MLLCPWDSPGKNTGVGCHSLLQGIFPTQGLNPGLLHCRQIVYYLSHQGSPYFYIKTYKAMFILVWPVHSYSWQCLLISRILNFDEIYCINISFCVECFLDHKEFSPTVKCGDILLCFLLSCCCSVTQSCPTLCDPMDCSMPGFWSIISSRSLLKLMFIELVMPSNHLILCCPFLLPLSIFPSIKVFSNKSVLCIRWPNYWSCSFI